MSAEAFHFEAEPNVYFNISRVLLSLQRLCDLSDSSLHQQTWTNLKILRKMSFKGSREFSGLQITRTKQIFRQKQILNYRSPAGKWLACNLSEIASGTAQPARWYRHKRFHCRQLLRIFVTAAYKPWPSL